MVALRLFLNSGGWDQIIHSLQVLPVRKVYALHEKERRDGGGGGRWAGQIETKGESERREREIEKTKRCI